MRYHPRRRTSKETTELRSGRRTQAAILEAVNRHRRNVTSIVAMPSAGVERRDSRSHSVRHGQHSALSNELIFFSHLACNPLLRATRNWCSAPLLDVRLRGRNQDKNPCLFTRHRGNDPALYLWSGFPGWPGPKTTHGPGLGRRLSPQASPGRAKPGPINRATPGPSPGRAAHLYIYRAGARAGETKSKPRREGQSGFGASLSRLIWTVDEAKRRPPPRGTKNQTPQKKNGKILDLAPPPQLLLHLELGFDLPRTRMNPARPPPSPSFTSIKIFDPIAFPFTATRRPDLSQSISLRAKPSSSDPIHGGGQVHRQRRAQQEARRGHRPQTLKGRKRIRQMACNKDVPVVLIDMHSCSLDSKIKMMLEAEVVERIVEVPDRKKSSAPAKGGRAKADNSKDPKRKRTPTAFFLFMYILFPHLLSPLLLHSRKDFRKDFKAAHPDIKGVTVEKKPYVDKAAELKAEAENAEGSGDNNVAAAEKEKKPKEKADDQDGEQEVDQSVKRRRINKVEEEEDEDEEENELDDDLDDDM
ncbi:hypothetical protein HU200_028311 [Digitaria exilis]|uniref:Uncharacterized protein n=1 Tax=Digitaria exilis TaxID=1010633 RepID=A0A835ETK0_9POAL|nr:hypothetical protein HU200_028311 [Digitaria exilis]